ncbi:MAG TPA: PAS domain S-box protein [Deltaproteobacteria bacterium]|jgi:PAS domain S-box-containing protein|nr:PAS domain S-box protein [Deltaproteobacteria bacterium]HOI06496.1 PAS domain S-box protein [Deltaproteobacteria bacterium]
MTKEPIPEPGFDSVFEDLDLGVVCLDASMRVTRANRAFSLMTDKPSGAFDGRPLGEVMPEDISVRLTEGANQARRENRPVVFEAPWDHQTGRLLRCRCVPSREGACVLLEDVTGVQAPPERRETPGGPGEPYAALFDLISQGVLEFDGNNRLVSSNRAAVSMLGLDLDRMKGATVQELFSTPALGVDSKTTVGRVVEAALSGSPGDGRQAVPHHVRIRNALTGRKRWYSLSLVAKPGEGSGPGGNVLLVLSDIDEMKESQATLEMAKLELEQAVKLRTSELMRTNRRLEEQTELLQKIIDSIPVMIILYGPDGDVRLFNREIEHLTGWTREQVLHGDVLSTFFSDPLELGEFWRTMVQSSPGWHDFRIVSRFWKALQSSWSGMRLSDGSLIAIGIDLSARRQMEQDIFRLAAAMDQAADGIILIDSSLIIRYVNNAFERLCGKGRDEAVGKSLDSLLELFEGNKPKAGRVMEELKAGRGTYTGLFRRRRADGDTVSMTVSVAPVYDGLGSLIDYVAVLRDVTETMKLQGQLAQTQRIEALDKFAGGIAHDLNNLLSPILMNIEELLEDEPAGTTRRDILEETLKAAQRQRDLVKMILAFGRKGDQVLKPVRIAPLLDETMAFLRSSLPSTIELRQRNEAHADVVMGDSIQIQQVIMNLCRNAADALEGHMGTISVKLSNTRLTETHGHEGLTEGEYLRLAVQDTGRGMRPEVMERVFEPFYTTKETGKGTGMGLSIAYGIVKSHGGTITVESAEGKGTLFKVYLPVSGATEQAREAPAEGPAPGEDRRKILLVDDEDIVLSSMERTLKSSGYQVAAFSDSREAFDAFSRSPNEYDVVITDLTMPGITGEELARRLLKIRPMLPVILCTGFNDAISQQEAKLFGISQLLLKPVGTGELKKVIHRVLEH